MLSAVLIFLTALAAQVSAEELVANRFDSLVDKLLDRPLSDSPPHYGTGLDATTFGKPLPAAPRGAATAAAPSHYIHGAPRASTVVAQAAQKPFHYIYGAHASAAVSAAVADAQRVMERNMLERSSSASWKADAQRVMERNMLERSSSASWEADAQAQFQADFADLAYSQRAQEESAANDLRTTPKAAEVDVPHAAAALAPKGRVEEVHSEEDLDLCLEQSSGLVGLEVVGAMCKQCRDFKPKYKRLAGKYDDIKFLTMTGNENDSTFRVANSRFNIKATPSFVFLRNGEEVARQRGADLENLRSMLDTA
jgi:thiol-disulfide isomerase/thioredoxin